jgi:hypothetical protein
MALHSTPHQNELKPLITTNQRKTMHITINSPPYNPAIPGGSHSKILKTVFGIYEGEAAKAYAP